MAAPDNDTSRRVEPPTDLMQALMDSIEAAKLAPNPEEVDCHGGNDS